MAQTWPRSRKEWFVKVFRISELSEVTRRHSGILSVYLGYPSGKEPGEGVWKGGDRINEGSNSSILSIGATGDTTRLSSPRGVELNSCQSQAGVWWKHVVLQENPLASCFVLLLMGKYHPVRLKMQLLQLFTFFNSNDQSRECHTLFPRFSKITNKTVAVIEKINSCEIIAE